MTTAKLSFCVSATGPDLRLIVNLDDTMIWDGYPDEHPITVEHCFPDDDREHVLHFEMAGKQSEHTQISAQGEIMQDRCIMISSLAFNDIQLGHLFTEVSRYHHDTNGTTAAVTQPFFGVMGCNGRVELQFSTPIYLWLLENI